MFFLEEVCSDQNILAIIYFIWTLLSWLLKIIPIILIVMVSLDFARNVIASGVDAMKKNLKMIIFRIVSCILCFLVPYFVATMNTVLGDLGVNYSKCLTAIANGVHVDNSNISSGIGTNGNDKKPGVNIGGSSGVVSSSGGNSGSNSNNKENSDYLYFLSLKRGNAMLLQSTDSNGKKIFGMYDIGSDKNCSGLLEELEAVIGDEPLEFLIASHYHGDHVGCFSSLAKKVKINNIYIKDSATSSFVNTAKKYGINTYKIKASSKSKENNNFYLVDSTNNKVNNSKLTIVNNSSDWNKSYGKLSFGKFDLTLLNLPERSGDGNYDSLVLYAKVNNYKLYLTGDLQNSADDSSSTSLEKNLANYYANFVSSSFGGSVDLYQAGHHATPQGTSSYMVKKIIDKKTVVVSTFTYDGFINQYNYMDKGDSSCFSKGSSGSSSRFRCFNDEVVNRIINGIYDSPSSNSTFVMYYQNMLSKKSSKKNVKEILKFNFNHSGEINTEGGYKIIYNYKKSAKRL